eukprot:1158892-Pelagomonas_calceolata.AAC.18
MDGKQGELAIGPAATMLHMLACLLSKLCSVRRASSSHEAFSGGARAGSLIKGERPGSGGKESGCTLEGGTEQQLCTKLNEVSGFLAPLNETLY